MTSSKEKTHQKQRTNLTNIRLSPSKPPQLFFHLLPFVSMSFLSVYLRNVYIHLLGPAKTRWWWLTVACDEVALSTSKVDMIFTPSLHLTVERRLIRVCHTRKTRTETHSSKWTVPEDPGSGSHARLGEILQRNKVKSRFQPSAVDHRLWHFLLSEWLYVVCNWAFHHILLALLKGSFELRVGAILRSNLCKRALRICRCCPGTTKALLQGRLLDSALWHPDGSFIIIIFPPQESLSSSASCVRSWLFSCRCHRSHRLCART